MQRWGYRPTEQRALGCRLLDSLEGFSGAEHDAVWSAEALRRDAEFDEDATLGRDAATVLSKARERLALSER